MTLYFTVAVISAEILLQGPEILLVEGQSNHKKRQFSMQNLQKHFHVYHIFSHGCAFLQNEIIHQVMLESII